MHYYPYSTDRYLRYKDINLMYHLTENACGSPRIYLNSSAPLLSIWNKEQLFLTCGNLADGSRHCHCHSSTSTYQRTGVCEEYLNLLQVHCSSQEYPEQRWMLAATSQQISWKSFVLIWFWTYPPNKYTEYAYCQCYSVSLDKTADLSSLHHFPFKHSSILMEVKISSHKPF